MPCTPTDCPARTAPNFRAYSTPSGRKLAHTRVLAPMPVNWSRRRHRRQTTTVRLSSVLSPIVFDVKHRLVLEPLAELHGRKPIALLERRHIRQWFIARSETPGMANMLVKVMRVFMKYV